MFGLKQSDIKQCIVCEEGVANSGQIFFWRMKVQRFGLISGAIQRQSGLEMYFSGAPKVAEIMSANEDIAKSVSEEIVIWICDSCSVKNPVIVSVFEKIEKLDRNKND